MGAWMNELVSSPLIQRVGWALVHFLWEGTAVALVLAGAMLLLRRGSSQARWLAACAALGLMAVLPVATACLVSIEPPLAGRAGMSAEPAPGMPPGDTGGFTVDEGRTEVAPAAPPAGEGAPSIPPATPVGAGASERASPAPKSWLRRAEDALRPFLPWGMAGWLAGVAALSVWHLGGWVLLEWARRRGVRPVGLAVRGLLDRLRRRLGVYRPVRLLESARIGVPAVVGWLRPVILMPAAALSGLAPAELEAVIAHELAHVRRYDGLIRLLQAVVETLLFYHPAVWWVSARIRRESEHCCDELAVASLGDRRGYAEALVRVAELSRPGPRLAPAAGGGSLLARIRRILGPPEQHSFPGVRWLAGAMILLCLIAPALLIHTGPATAQTPAAATSPAPGLSSTQPQANRRGRYVRTVESGGRRFFVAIVGETPGSRISSQEIVLLDGNGKILDTVECRINGRYGRIHTEVNDTPASDGAVMVIRFKGIVSGWHNWHHITYRGKTYAFWEDEGNQPPEWDQQGLCRVGISDGRLSVIFPRLWPRPEGIGLEFRQVAFHPGSKHGPVLDGGKEYANALTALGPEEADRRGPSEWRWFELQCSPPDLSVVAQYARRRYIYLCNVPSRTIVPHSEGPKGAAWGLEWVRLERDARGRPVIGFQLDGEGIKRFEAFAEVSGETAPLAAVVDGKVLSTMRFGGIRAGKGEIQGDFTREEAARLVQALAAGMVNSRTAGPGTQPGGEDRPGGVPKLGRPVDGLAIGIAPVDETIVPGMVVRLRVRVENTSDRPLRLLGPVQDLVNNCMLSLTCRFGGEDKTFSSYCREGHVWGRAPHAGRVVTLGGGEGWTGVVTVPTRGETDMLRPTRTGRYEFRATLGVSGEYRAKSWYADGWIGPADSPPAVVNVVADDEDIRRRIAQGVAVVMGEQNDRGEAKYKAVEELVIIGRRAGPALEQMLLLPPYRQRCWAIDFFCHSELQTPAAVRRLEAILHASEDPGSEDYGILVGAVKGGRLTGSELTELRRMALNALVNARRDESDRDGLVRLCRPLLSDRDQTIREAARDWVKSIAGAEDAATQPATAPGPPMGR